MINMFLYNINAQKITLPQRYSITATETLNSLPRSGHMLPQFRRYLHR